MSAEIGDKELQEAWDRVARTSDGKMIYLHLQRRLMGVMTGGDSCTLRADNGERKFAAKLIGLMAKGISESGGLSDPIVTFVRAGPVAVSSAHGARRRVTDATFVRGYSDPDAEPGTSAAS